MPEYDVMFPADDEAQWEAAPSADHQATFDTDAEFAQRLKARGGAVTGGAALEHSRSATTLRRGPGPSPMVTDGPYTETVEQLSGLFVVTCEHYAALVDVAQVLLRAHPVVEIRPVEEL